ncbi:uncharacterized protein ASCRUDRAFT_150773 [Ascoidea rubescens DSM 1968]|uniref:K Homology domain-containing protein n=1 Tax=Ascoidea rubescens DSM 1968 TaxID=1344418 RepID=A0A1D2VGS1_9ASCO|nr:hypothetical protein ASCRUDRAFT_150773 [Ascoidea rubescens DSM 1968]ODV60836.1 hypothetical protein ASCRUDRAFT_150773 [Ascoidea rubescens DSM 1968]
MITISPYSTANEYSNLLNQSAFQFNPAEIYNSTNNLNNEYEFFTIIPLKYEYLVKPSPINNINSTSNINIIYESSNNLWNKVIQNNQPHYVIDNLLHFKSFITNINANVGGISIKIDENNCFTDNIFTISIFANDFNLISTYKKKLLQFYNSIISKSISFNQNSINLNQNYQNLILSLNDISSYCNVTVLISNQFFDFKFNLPIDSRLSSPIRNQNTINNEINNFNVYILGDSNNVNFAESRVRLVLDDFQGLYLDSLDLNLSLLPLVAGIQFNNLKNISKQSGANLYLPNLLPGLYNSTKPTSSTLSKIHFSGLQSQVILAKSLIEKIIKSSTDQIYFKDSHISHDKNDLLLLNYQEKILSIMIKYSSFIQLVPLGHDNKCIIRIQASSISLVDNSMDELMNLLTNIYEVEFKLLNKNNESQQFLFNFLNNISIKTNTCLTLNKNSLYNITGLNSDVKQCIKLLQLFKQFNKYPNNIQIHYKIELPNSQRDFVSGKKNGKMIRIMNNTNVLIKYTPLNEYNFNINLISNDISASSAAIQLLEDEFPSEISFFIPEAYHRQVIGSGGLTIQQIMRKYNVFIKFSNTYDYQQNMFSFIRHENVVIRCPSKNSKAIPSAKSELDSLCNECSNLHLTTFVKISRSQWRLIVSKYVKNEMIISEIEKKTSCFINFPCTEPSESAIIEIRGNDNASEEAAKSLKKYYPNDYVFKITFSNQFNTICSENNQEFLDKIIVPLRILLNMEVQVYSAIELEKKDSNEVACQKLVLSYLAKDDMNGKNLNDAVGHISSFLEKNSFEIFDKGEVLDSQLIIKGSASTSLGSILNNKSFNRRSLRNNILAPPIQFSFPAAGSKNSNSDLSSSDCFSSGGYSPVSCSPISRSPVSQSPISRSPISPSRQLSNNDLVQMENSIFSSNIGSLPPLKNDNFGMNPSNHQVPLNNISNNFYSNGLLSSPKKTVNLGHKRFHLMDDRGGSNTITNFNNNLANINVSPGRYSNYSTNNSTYFYK